MGVSEKLRREDGFTLIEAVVAMGVVFTALVMLASMTVNVARDLAFARQRQAANGIANQLLEDVRGLAYATLEKGLSTSDLPGDPMIVGCADGPYFEVCPPDPGAEKIVASPSLPDVAPLVPHRGTFGAPDYPTTYAWSVYVTEANDAPEAGAYRVTSLVTWENAQRGGTGEVQAQTLVFSPEGCVNPSTHPFAAPCESFYRGFGTVDPGSVVTKGSVQTMAFDSMILTLPEVRADVQEEQATLVTGSVRLPGGQRIVGGVETGAGLAAAGTAADDDPGSPATDHDSASVLPQPGESVSVLGDDKWLKVEVAGGDDAQTTSTTAASGSSPCVGQVNGQPCGYGEIRPTGQTRKLLYMGAAVGTTSLVTFHSQTSPSTAYGLRDTPAGDEGLVRETVVRRLPTIGIGGLPSSIAGPAGWNGHAIRLVSYEATAEAEAGVGTDAPTATIISGALEIWNGSGYDVVPITASGGDVVFPSLSYSAQNSQGETITVQIDATLTVQASSTTETISEAGNRTLAEAILGTPLAGTVHYRLQRAGALIADLSLDVQLGSAAARAAFQEAPTA